MGMKTSYTYDALRQCHCHGKPEVGKRPVHPHGGGIQRPQRHGRGGQRAGQRRQLPRQIEGRRGNAVTRELNEDYTLKRVTDPTGQAVEYEYDAARRVTA